jgi:hypothetical protein
MIYTAITRAKSKCYFLYDDLQNVAHNIQNFNKGFRNTIINKVTNDTNYLQLTHNPEPIDQEIIEAEIIEESEKCLTAKKPQWQTSIIIDNPSNYCTNLHDLFKLNELNSNNTITKVQATFIPIRHTLSFCVIYLYNYDRYAIVNTKSITMDQSYVSFPSLIKRISIFKYKQTPQKGYITFDEIEDELIADEKLDVLVKNFKLS